MVDCPWIEKREQGNDMQAIKETAADLLRNHPHLCCLLGFSAVVAYGVAKLVAIMPVA